MKSREQRAAATTSRRAVVELAEAYVRAHTDTPLALRTLCQVVGVSERGLRNAFYSVHGVSPKRWILAERLHLVRRALIESGDTPTTVTRAATGHGFYELGRFAASYRGAFGEAPSATLRGTHHRQQRHETKGEYGRALSCLHEVPPDL